LEELQKAFPALVSNVRGKGLMCAFDLPSPQIRDAFLQCARENKVLILPCGSRSIRFRPALNISFEDMDSGLEAIRRSLAKLSG